MALLGGSAGSSQRSALLLSGTNTPGKKGLNPTWLERSVLKVLQQKVTDYCQFFLNVPAFLREQAAGRERSRPLAKVIQQSVPRGDCSRGIVPHHLGLIPASALYRHRAGDLKLHQLFEFHGRNGPPHQQHNSKYSNLFSFSCSFMCRQHRTEGWFPSCLCDAI